MKDYIKSYIKTSIETKNLIFENLELLSKIEKASNKIINAYLNNRKILLAGNGGSAADAQHIAAELVSKFCVERPALNAIALTTNTSILTAIGNDYSNEYIFSRQIQAYGNKDDIYITISTSGNSKNIIKSIEEAKRKGLYIIGLTGNKNCDMDYLCDLIIKVPSDKTPIIQESHIMIGHIICSLVEKSIFIENS